MAQNVGVVLQGDKALERKLRELTGAKLLTVVAKATQRAMKPVIAQARSLVPVESATLRRSLGAKTKKYPGSASVVTIVGPRKGFSRMVEIDGRPQLRNPVKYAHLVELGHRIARRGEVLLRRGESVTRGLKRAREMTDEHGQPAPKRLGHSQGFVVAHPFILPAFLEQQSAIIARYREELAEALEAEAARKAAR